MGFRGADVARAVAGFVARYWAVAALLIGWEAWVVMGGLNPIVMPRPSHVLAEILKRPSTYFGSALETLLLASVGLALGMLLGIAIAAAAWMSRILTGLLTPITLIFSSVPVIALIPVIARVLGYDVRTVLAIVVIISFFPAFVFAGNGRGVPDGHQRPRQCVSCCQGRVQYGKGAGRECNRHRHIGPRLSICRNRRAPHERALEINARRFEKRSLSCGLHGPNGNDAALANATAPQPNSRLRSRMPEAAGVAPSAQETLIGRSMPLNCRGLQTLLVEIAVGQSPADFARNSSG
jgi:hypothetical protein